LDFLSQDIFKKPIWIFFLVWKKDSYFKSSKSIFLFTVQKRFLIWRGSCRLWRFPSK
jgi:DNA gyrase inhibitor GyrI